MLYVSFLHSNSGGSKPTYQDAYMSRLISGHKISNFTGPSVKELRNFPNRHVSESSWKCLLQPQSSLQMTIAYASISWKTEKKKTYNEDTPKILTHRNSNICICCFKILNFIVICYKALDNQYFIFYSKTINLFPKFWWYFVYVGDL